MAKEKQKKSDLFDDEAGMDVDVIPTNNTQKTSDEEDAEEDEYEDEQVNKKRRRKNKKNAQVLNSDDEEASKKKSASKKPPSKKPNNNQEIDKMFNKENQHTQEHQAGEISSSAGKKKQLITKTFIDEDGYQGN